MTKAARRRRSGPTGVRCLHSPLDLVRSVVFRLASAAGALAFVVDALVLRMLARPAFVVVALVLVAVPLLPESFRLVTILAIPFVLIGISEARRDLPDGERRVRRGSGRRPSAVMGPLAMATASVLVVVPAPPGSGEPRELAPALDDSVADGTYATMVGTVRPEYVDFCLDLDRDERCDGRAENIDWYYVLVGDDGRGLIVRSDVTPERRSPGGPGRTRLTGVVREARELIGETLANEDLGGTLSRAGVRVSPRFLLSEGERPAEGPLRLAVAAALALVGALLVLGLRTGYLVFRSAPAPPLLAGADLRAGDAIETRITGPLLGSDALMPVRLGSVLLPRPLDPGDDRGAGHVRVREAHGELLRVPLYDVETADGAPTTLAAVTLGPSEGAPLGAGEVREMELGTAYAARGPRPAIRAETARGDVVLTFARTEDRDRAARELAAESGLYVGPDGRFRPRLRGP